MARSSSKSGSKNFQAFIKTDLSKVRPGQYVLMVNGKVYKQGKNIEKMLKTFKREHPRKRPFVAKVPEKGLLVV